MMETPQIDITGSAFAARLADLLRATRAAQHQRLGRMARRSAGRFEKHDLHAYEHGLRTIDDELLDELVQLYGCDLGAIMPARLPVEVTPLAVSVGGIHHDYTGTGDDAVLNAYLSVVHTLRHRRHTALLDLRRDDLEVLAGYLHTSRESVLHRLATLINASPRKRAAMAGVLASGAAVVGLVGTATTGGDGGGSTPLAPIDAVPTTLTEPTTPVGQPVVAQPTPTTVVAAMVATIASDAVVPQAGPAESAADTTTEPLLEINIPVTTELVEVGDPPLPPEF